MELEQAFRMSDFYIQSLDDIHTVQEVKRLHDEMVLDYAAVDPAKIHFLYPTGLYDSDSCIFSASYRSVRETAV